MCFYKYKVSITTKFLMMKWKTGPCDRSKAYISDRIAANLASTPLIPQQKCSHTPFIYIYMQTYQILTFFSLFFCEPCLFSKKYYQISMAIRLPGIMHAKQILRRSNSFGKKLSSPSIDVPKGYIAIYVGVSERRCFVIPISFLRKIIRYSRSTINACSLLSHEWWVPP